MRDGVRRDIEPLDECTGVISDSTDRWIQDLRRLSELLACGLGEEVLMDATDVAKAIWVAHNLLCLNGFIIYTVHLLDIRRQSWSEFCGCSTSKDCNLIKMRLETSDDRVT